MTDPIADMLTRIRNAQKVGKVEVLMPHSRLKHHVADVLVKEGYLVSAAVDKTGRHPQLKVVLRYISAKPVINEINRISKPGRRKYVPAKSLKPVLSGLGINILTTSQGVMTDKEARRLKIGGEILCQVF